MTLSMVACGEKTGNDVTPTTAPTATTAPTEAPEATATPVPTEAPVQEASIDFEDGYITIAAKKEREEKSCNKEKDCIKYLRRERYFGNCQRKFYVGEINENDIKASFMDGILTLSFPKESKKKETKRIINID